MRRPWFTYILLFAGIVALLGAVFRPVVGATSVPPGARLVAAQNRLEVRPGSPLARAGIRTGDRFVSSEVVEVTPSEGGPVLRWTRDVPRSGSVRVERAGRAIWREVRPAPPWLGVQLLWALVGLLNVALSALALALFWQRPRDAQALLLGLVLLAAPVFAFPREPRLLPLALAAHFFTVFPTFPAPDRRTRRWRVALIYALFVLLGLSGSSLWQQGRVASAIATYNLLAFLYALYAVVLVLLRWRRASPEQLPVFRTLALASGAMLLAVLGGFSQRGWLFRDQVLPANLIPALLFSGAVGHLVFRLRALEVRLTARRTLQYLLARWTLGTLFLIPGFMLVWRLGQLSAAHSSGRPADILPFLLWMFVAALLLGKRSEVLRNLDRRFFRDAYTARQTLVQLAGELGAQPSAAGVLATLEAGVRRALNPRTLSYAPPGDVPDAGGLTLPVRHGHEVRGYLCLGAKSSGAEYTGEERELLESVAAQAGTALENARLHAELMERQRAELAARSAGVLSGAEDERRRLAADLHDHVLPELRAIAGEVEQLQARSNGLAPDLQELASDVRATMDGVRDVMEALRPSALDMLGLFDALESCARRAASRVNPPVLVSVRRSGSEPLLTPEQSLTLYRMCQEAVQNGLRHAGASRIGLWLETAGDRVHITIWDDGRGFDPARATAGRGLGNIRYRADLIGAEVRWDARPEGGTEVSISVRCGQPPDPLTAGVNDP